MIGARSEELVKEAFSHMDVHLDLNMTMTSRWTPTSRVPERVWGHLQTPGEPVEA